MRFFSKLLIDDDTLMVFGGGAYEGRKTVEVLNLRILYWKLLQEKIPHEHNRRACGLVEVKGKRSVVLIASKYHRG